MVDLLNGMSKRWYESGALAIEGEWKDSLKINKEIFWFENGAKESEYE